MRYATAFSDDGAQWFATFVRAGLHAPWAARLVQEGASAARVALEAAGFVFDTPPDDVEVFVREDARATGLRSYYRDPATAARLAVVVEFCVAQDPTTLRVASSMSIAVRPLSAPSPALLSESARAGDLARVGRSAATLPIPVIDPNGSAHTALESIQEGLDTLQGRWRSVTAAELSPTAEMLVRQLTSVLSS